MSTPTFSVSLFGEAPVSQGVASISRRNMLVSPAHSMLSSASTATPLPDAPSPSYMHSTGSSAGQSGGAHHRRSMSGSGAGIRMTAQPAGRHRAGGMPPLPPGLASSGGSAPVGGRQMNPHGQSSGGTYQGDLYGGGRGTPTGVGTSLRPPLPGGTAGQASTGGAKGSSSSTNAAQPHHGAAVFSRVRVAVRCRPPFAEEGAYAAINVLPHDAVLQCALPTTVPGDTTVLASASLPRGLHVEVQAGKKREFAFDVVFGPSANNTDVYNVIGGPVIDGVLKGVNGTILAYGQTGSGKTHSLGILTRVTGESGIIPRSLSHIFGAIAQVQQHHAKQIAEVGIGAGDSSGRIPTLTHSVTLSFCQLYLDTVQDLLVPSPGQAAPGQNLSAGGGSGGDGLNTSFNDAASTASMGSASTNVHSRHAPTRTTTGPEFGSNSGSQLAGTGPGLQVREDPSRGFYVEGLSEYAVRSFTEACALLNWGLENRVLGATRMNATSSRSHTILTVRIETRTPVRVPGSGTDDSASAYGYVSRRSQLMLCDLAGSERVRRTSSRGARLEEARAINASLHTLGQVIAALSVLSAQANSGTAGPRAHIPWRDSKLTRLLYGNLGGSSNTFLLATVGPGVRNVSESLSTLLFASRCMRVTAQPVLASALSNYGNADYADLCAKLQSRLSTVESTHAVEMAGLVGRYEAALLEMASQLDATSRERNDAIMQSAAAINGSQLGGGGGGDYGHRPLTSEAMTLHFDPDGRAFLLAPFYNTAISVFDASLAALLAALYRAGRHSKSWKRALEKAREEESIAADARNSMMASDPLFLLLEARAAQRRAPTASSTTAAGGSASAAGVQSDTLSRLTTGRFKTQLTSIAHPDMYGPHLGHAYRSAAAALATVHMTHAGNGYLTQTSQHTGMPASSTSTAHNAAGELTGGETEDTGFTADFAQADESMSAASIPDPGGATPVDSRLDETGSGALVGSLLGPPAVPAGARLSPFALGIVTGNIRVRDSRGGGGGESGGPDSSRSGFGSGPTHRSGSRGEDLDGGVYSTDEVLAALSLGMVGGQAAHAQAPAPHSPSFDSPHDVGIDILPLVAHPDLSSFSSSSELISYLEKLQGATQHNICRLNALAAVKDARFDDVKRHLAAAEAAVRVRDEDAANQRYVLRYLVDTTSALREDIRRLRQAHTYTSLTASGGSSHVGSGMFTSGQQRGGGGSVGLSTPIPSPVPSPTRSVEDAFSGGERLHTGVLSAADAAAEAFLYDEDSSSGHLGRAVDGEHTPTGSSGSHEYPHSTRRALGKMWQRQLTTTSTTATNASHDGASVLHPEVATYSASLFGVDGGIEAESSTKRRADAVADTPRRAVSSNSTGNGEGAPLQPTSVSTPTTAEMRLTARAPTPVKNTQSAAFAPKPATATAGPSLGPVTAAGGARGSASAAVLDSSVGASTPLSPFVTSMLNHIPRAGAGPTVEHDVTPSPTPLGGGTQPRRRGSSVGESGGEEEEEEDEGVDETYDSFDYADEGDGAAGDGEDEVEYIVSHRLVPGTGSSSGSGSDGGAGGTVLYRVHWRGTAPTDDEWFDREDLRTDFPQAVAEYERRNKALPWSRRG